MRFLHENHRKKHGSIQITFKRLGFIDVVDHQQSKISPSKSFLKGCTENGGLVVGIEKQILPSFHSCNYSCIHRENGGKTLPHEGPLI